MNTHNFRERERERAYPESPNRNPSMAWLSNSFSISLLCRIVESCDEPGHLATTLRNLKQSVLHSSMFTSHTYMDITHSQLVHICYTNFSSHATLITMLIICNVFVMTFETGILMNPLAIVISHLFWGIREYISLFEL